MLLSNILPRVSVVITTHNRRYLLARAVDSLLVQSYPQPLLEIIIIDDCSDDDTSFYLQELEKAYTNIFICSNEYNLGQTASLIKGIELTTGSLIAWVDDDDFLHSDCIRLCVDQFQTRPNIDLLYTDYFISSNSQIFKGSRCSVPYSSEILLTYFCCFHFRLFKRSIYDRCPLDLYFKRAQDYDFCLRVSEVGTIYHLPIPLYYYTVHSASVSATSQLEQLTFSYQAILNALDRRGLSDKYNLLINPQFALCGK